MSCRSRTPTAGRTTLRSTISLTIGTGANAATVANPLINAGQIFAGNTAALNRIETFTLNIVRGDRRTGVSQPITDAGTGRAVFEKPVDNIGNKSIPDYAAYAKAHIYSINIPGCATPGKVFVGQRNNPRCSAAFGDHPPPLVVLASNTARAHCAKVRASSTSTSASVRPLFFRT